MPYVPQRFDVRTFLIYIDSYEDGVPVGQYHNLCREELVEFHSLTQLLLHLDQSLDVDNMPQSFNKVRTFFPLNGYGLETMTKAAPRSGRLATFSIHVLFRRNASWQGTLSWLDEGRVQNFRSVMELIMLLNSALENVKNSRWNEEDELQELAE